MHFNPLELIIVFIPTLVTVNHRNFSASASTMIYIPITLCDCLQFSHADIAEVMLVYCNFSVSDVIIPMSILLIKLFFFYCFWY